MSRVASATDALSAQAELSSAIGALGRAGIDSARLDAELLLASSWGMGRTRLFLRSQAAVPAAVREQFHTLLQRRLAREPIAYILGEREFWSLQFSVCKDVLIPRPDTETLVERALARMNALAAERPADTPLRIADVGTGSGCIAIALAVERPDIELIAIDVSPDALAVAQRNAEEHGVSDRIDFRVGNLLGDVPAASLDMVVSNPPYVASADLQTLEPELDFEPAQALDGGRDGLDVIRQLVPDAARALRGGGRLLVEHGADQAAAIRALFRTLDWNQVRSALDLSGRERVVEACRQRGT